MTDSIADANGPSRQRPRRVVINRAPTVSEVQHRLETDRRRYGAGMVDPDRFASALSGDFSRRRHGGADAVVASIAIFEFPGLRHRHDEAYLFDLVSELIGVIARRLGPSDLFHVAENGDVLVLGRDAPVDRTIARIDRLCGEIAGRRFDAADGALLLTPSAGVATLDDADNAATVVKRAVDAREVAEGHLDLRVTRWEPAMSADTVDAPSDASERVRWTALKERLRTPTQIFATYVLGLVVPFCLYWMFDAVLGVDVTWPVYMFCVATLVTTGVTIMIEAQLAVRQKEPPEVDEYPDATAVICAYLPNEAGTIMETLDAFLDQGYAGNLQIILAYNSPVRMPVERELHALADRHPSLDVVRVEGSTSKAQNVNAVLHMATGEFTGMFDADHMPRPGSFERAWRWLANGYDVVQGHCLTRNGEETLLARMIAVEFESIYAVAHPGRARLHRFGVFGGSNGYWKTDLLHETRMRGSMLTEDIDSSMRTVERGLKIRSDRDIVSRELATTTVKQVWNQRMRWAQGWCQVSLRHTVRVWRSPGLTTRQKVGATYLLGWREVYPWLSLQVLPLIAYWLFIRGDGFSAGWPIFFFTTLFVLHVGPAQTWFAYRLADPEIKQHTSWFWAYLAFSTLVYTEFKNTIARVAHIKEFLGERAWKVTPRGGAPIDFGDDDDLLDDDLLDDANGDAGDGVAGGPGETRPHAPVGQMHRVDTAGRRLSGDPDATPGRSVLGEPLVPSSPGEIDATDGFIWPSRAARIELLRRTTSRGGPRSSHLRRQNADEAPLPVRRVASHELAEMVVSLQEATRDDVPVLPRRSRRQVSDWTVPVPGTLPRRSPSRLGADEPVVPAGDASLGEAESGETALPVRRVPSHQLAEMVVSLQEATPDDVPLLPRRPRRRPSDWTDPIPRTPPRPRSSTTGGDGPVFPPAHQAALDEAASREAQLPVRRVPSHQLAEMVVSLQEATPDDVPLLPRRPRRRASDWTVPVPGTLPRRRPRSLGQDGAAGEPNEVSPTVWRRDLE